MDAPSIGVLRDTALLVWLALLVGVIAYQVLRVTLTSLQPTTGKVDVDAFASVDAIIVAALSVIFLSGLQTAGSSMSAEAKVMELTLNGTLVNIVFQLGICVALLVYVRALRDLNPTDLFGLRRLPILYVAGLALLAMIPTIILVNGTALGIHEWMKGFWPDLAGQDVAEAFRNSKDPWVKTLAVISAAIIAPLVEEIVFRGFIYGVMKRYTDGLFAALCSSLFFAAIHLHVGTLIPLTLLALVFCYMYEHTGSLLVPMVMHGLFNATSLTVMFFFPDIQP